MPQGARRVPGEARGVPLSEQGLVPRQPANHQQEQAVPGRSRPVAASTIRTLTKTEACALMYIQLRTDERPLLGCSCVDLERHVAETLGTPVHGAIEELYLIKDLLSTPVGHDGQTPLRSNLICTDRGLALADMYRSGRLMPVPDREAPPSVSLPGDIQPGQRIVAPVDARPGPTGDFGEARARSRGAGVPERVN